MKKKSNGVGRCEIGRLVGLVLGTQLPPEEVCLQCRSAKESLWTGGKGGEKGEALPLATASENLCEACVQLWEKYLPIGDKNGRGGPLESE